MDYTTEIRNIIRVGLLYMQIQWLSKTSRIESNIGQKYLDSMYHEQNCNPVVPIMFVEKKIIGQNTKCKVSFGLKSWGQNIAWTKSKGTKYLWPKIASTKYCMDFKYLDKMFLD